MNRNRFTCISALTVSEWMWVCLALAFLIHRFIQNASRWYVCGCKTLALDYYVRYLCACCELWRSKGVVSPVVYHCKLDLINVGHINWLLNTIYYFLNVFSICEQWTQKFHEIFWTWDKKKYIDMYLYSTATKWIKWIILKISNSPCGWWPFVSKW